MSEEGPLHSSGLTFDLNWTWSNCRSVKMPAVPVMNKVKSFCLSTTLNQTFRIYRRTGTFIASFSLSRGKLILCSRHVTDDMTKVQYPCLGGTEIKAAATLAPFEYNSNSSTPINRVGLEFLDPTGHCFGVTVMTVPLQSGTPPIFYSGSRYFSACSRLPAEPCPQSQNSVVCAAILPNFEAPIIIVFFSLGPEKICQVLNPLKNIGRGQDNVFVQSSNSVRR